MNTSFSAKYVLNQNVFIIINGQIVEVKIDHINPFSKSYTFKDPNDEVINQPDGIPLQLPESIVYASYPEAEQALEGITVSEIMPNSDLNSSSNSILPNNNNNNQQTGGIRSRRKQRRTIKKRSKKTKKTRRSRRRI